MIATGVAVVPAIRNSEVHWPAFWSFGLTTMATVFAVRLWILPALPLHYSLGDWGVLERDKLLMVMFGVVLLLAGLAMLRHTSTTRSITSSRPMMLSGIGVAVGAVAGLLGVGGGFLMTPALVLWGKLDMKTAVGTSIALICVNSAVGVTGDLVRGAVFDWPLVLSFAVLTTIGIIAGIRLRNKIPASNLRRLFGWVVIGIGIIVLATEVVFP